MIDPTGGARIGGDVRCCYGRQLRTREAFEESRCPTTPETVLRFRGINKKITGMHQPERGGIAAGRRAVWVDSGSRGCFTRRAFLRNFVRKPRGWSSACTVNLTPFFLYPPALAPPGVGGGLA